MCGITGFFNSQQLTNNPIPFIQRMTDHLSHRGPDDHGIWHDTHIALGHRRLAIVDLNATGSQPMHSHSGRYVIVYNGEIYNVIQLKKSLSDNAFVGHSDTEVLLTCIEQHGLEKTLGLINGMFAFALWDKQEKVLHLARDRIGEKPLYYGLIKQTLVFASEIGALKVYPDFQMPISTSSVSKYLQYGYIPAPYSIYDNIYKLMPGTYLSLSQTTQLPSPTTYWSAIEIAEKGIHNPLVLTDEDAKQQLEARLNSVIRERMVSEVPIGAFLSGGIDSSLITALMQAQSTQPIKTFTIGFEESGYNEAHYAKKIASYLQTDHTELYINAKEALNLIPTLPDIYGEPFADSSAIPTFLVSKLARQQVTVALSGDGGDEIFGGYNRYLWGQRLWQKMSWTPFFLRLALQKTCQHSSRLLQPAIGQKLQKLAGILTINSPAELYQQLISQGGHHYLLHPQSNTLCLSTIDSMNFIEKMMITDTISYLPDDIMVKVDRAGMAVSLENRAPFLDHELIEWAWQLPLQFKIRHRTSKWLLRQVLENYLPKPLIDRPKMGFGIPLGAWLRGPLKEWAADLLDQRTLEQQGILNANLVQKTWQQHVSGKHNWQYALWTILMFQAWMATCKKDFCLS